MTEAGTRSRARPMSQIEIEEELCAVDERAEEILESFRDALETQASAESKYKSAHAAAYLRKSGPVKEREAHADYVTEAELQAFLISQAIVKYTRAAIDAQDRRHETLRTLNANLRPLVSDR